MSKEATILALIASVTTGQILFLAVYLWVRSNKHLPNRILSLFLFCYSLRIIKSVLLLSFPGISFSAILISFGVIGMSGIGPLLFFYVQSLLKNNFVITYKELLHFIPAILLLPTAFFLDDNSMFLVYQFSVYQIFFYLIYSLIVFIQAKKEDHTSSTYKWLVEIFVAVGLLAVIFLIQLYGKNRTLYITVSLLAAVVFYAISLRAAFGKNIFYPLLKRKTKVIKSILLPSIENKLRNEQLYLNPRLTVSKLANALNIPAHTLSAAINEGAGMSFNEYMNTFRIEEAARRLSSSKYENLSIEGIAYDCGFNSLSAFYNAFKKINKLTPAKFRQQIFPDSENQEDYIPNPVRV